jgi:Asp-tRNA(Asn)/Glu-tRNA(Gln) amidotransferase B subunit
MKITKSQLRQIIKEEIQKSLNEELSKEESMAEIKKLVDEGAVTADYAKKLVDEAGDDERKLANAYRTLRTNAAESRKAQSQHGDPRFY